MTVEINGQSEVFTLESAQYPFKTLNEFSFSTSLLTEFYTLANSLLITKHRHNVNWRFVVQCVVRFINYNRSFPVSELSKLCYKGSALCLLSVYNPFAPWRKVLFDMLLRGLTSMYTAEFQEWQTHLIMVVNPLNCCMCHCYDWPWVTLVMGKNIWQAYVKIDVYYVL